MSRRAALRALVVLSVLLGSNYLVWRWLFSVAWQVWPVAVPLLLAETYSFVDALLFGLTMWRPRTRPPPPPPADDATVDVFVTTYNEPVEMVLATARAAAAIRHPHLTWVLDDGARPQVRAAVEAEGIGYLTRSGDWHEHPRHAKAGNLNDALWRTQGEFVLVLDADQVPAPAILDHTLGYFRDPRTALVQTPQFFVNVTPSDPLGSQAPLFYGPIQQGKDGWNAAFFCGSNAVLRRDALMQIGLTNYVRETERSVRKALATADRVLVAARRSARDQGPLVAGAIEEVRDAVRVARTEVRRGAHLAATTFAFQQRVDQVARSMVAADMQALHSDLDVMGELVDVASVAEGFEGDVAVRRLSDRDWSPLGAIESVGVLVRSVDLDRSGEALPVMPLATISVTEDMATAMRLHALGWKSVYHHEVLARGLAPEDLRTMLHQRLRWAQGTLQVMLRENPLVQRGLSWGQRLMYLATMWTYLSGFAAVAYIGAPILYLLFGLKPVDSYGPDFIAHLVPYLVVQQTLFFVVGRGMRTWRGQQYSLALFPLWIRACTTAVANVVFGRSLGFVVTPKTRQEGGRQWRLIRPQLVAMGLLAAAAVIGLLRVLLGQAPILGFGVNLVWVGYDLVVLSVVVQAARFVPEPAAAPSPAVVQS